MADLKNIVVIGLGLTAAKAIHELDKSLPSTHRIVVIADSPAAFYPPASLRAAVVPGWEKKATISYDRFFPANTRHLVLANTTVTKLTDSTVTLDRAHEPFGTEIAFDACIVATGSRYAFPARPSGEWKTVEDIEQGFRTMQAQIKAAKSILVIGAGPVGVEFCGEVASAYTGAEKKQITLAEGGSRVLGMAEGIVKKVGDDLESQLKRHDVRIVFNARADIKGLETGPLDPPRTIALGEAEKVEADFVLLAFGNKPTSSFVEESFGPDAVNAKKQVKVRQTLQLVSHDRVFAIGDVTDLAELKTYAAGKNHGAVAAANIVSLIKGQNQLKDYKTQAPLMAVSVGPSGGAIQLFGFKLGKYFTSLIKSRTLFVSEFESNFVAK